MAGELYSFAAVFATAGVGIAWLDWMLRALVGEAPQETRPARKGRRGERPITNGLAGNASQQEGPPNSGSLGLDL